MTLFRSDLFRPSQEMLRLVAEIDEFKGAWRSLQNIAPERLTALRRVATIESVGSSTRIEGVRLSNAEIKAVPTLVGIAVTTISYRMLRKTYETLGEIDKAAALQTKMDAFERTAKAYQEATKPLLNREDYSYY